MGGKFQDKLHPNCKLRPGPPNMLQGEENYWNPRNSGKVGNGGKFGKRSRGKTEASHWIFPVLLTCHDPQDRMNGGSKTIVKTNCP